MLLRTTARAAQPFRTRKKAIRGRFVDALRTVADTSSMQDAHEALVAAVFTVQKEMACLKETIRKVKTIPPEQPAAQVEQTEVIREVREKTASAKAQSKITGKLSSQTSRLETMLRRKNPEKRLAEKYTHEERRQAMKGAGRDDRHGHAAAGNNCKGGAQRR